MLSEGVFPDSSVYPTLQKISCFLLEHVCCWAQEKAVQASWSGRFIKQDKSHHRRLRNEIHSRDSSPVEVQSQSQESRSSTELCLRTTYGQWMIYVLQSVKAESISFSPHRERLFYQMFLSYVTTCSRYKGWRKWQASWSIPKLPTTDMRPTPGVHEAEGKSGVNSLLSLSIDRNWSSHPTTEVCHQWLHFKCFA